MLSNSKLVVGAEDYYLEQVGSGLEEYYTGAGEAPGTWLGSACRELGLSGDVTPDDLRRLLRGCHPASGTELTTSRLPPARRVAGWDLTMSAPKSVSLLYGLGEAPVSDAVRDAHDDAVRDALSYLEHHAAYARRGHAGAERLDTSGLVAAGFRHRTSRAGDPQLHTHVLVANLVHGADGRWSSVYSALLYYQGRAAGFVYQTSLRAGLTSRLGVDFDEPHNGCAEITGMPRSLVEQFSTRRAEIEARLAEIGATSRRAREIATLETRRAKEESTDSPEHLRDAWRRRAATAGLSPETLDAVLGVPRQPRAPDLDVTAKHLLGREGLTANDSTFERRHVVAAVAEGLREGGRLSAVEARVEWLLGEEDVVALGTSGPGGGPLHTTGELLDIERKLVARAERGRDARSGTVDHEIVEAVLAERPAMAGEQEEMVRRLTTSGAGVEVVVGKAGAGKTYALDAARAAWQRDGYRVQGTALSARAVAELESGSGIASCTLAGLSRSLLTGETILTPRDVIIVDEAGMVGSRMLNEVLFMADGAGSKVVLVGDHRQLPEIEAGGVLRVLAGRLGAVTLSTNRRQVEGWERQALDELRHGSVPQALAAYEEHGRVHLCDSARTARLAMVQAWADARSDGTDARMYAQSRRDVEDLNLLAREELRCRGRLGEDALYIGARAFAPGDEVVFCRNDPRLGVLNGTRGTVVSADAGGLVVETARGEKVLDVQGAEETRLDHGYASTVYKAQGATVERAFVLGGDALYREAGYVAMSRARDTTELYVVTSAFDEGLAGPASEVGCPGFTRVLSASRAKHLALEYLDPELSARPGLGRPGDAGPAGLADDLDRAARISRHLLGEVAAIERPERLRVMLGEPPELPAKRSIWVRAAGAMEAFVRRLGADNLTPPLLVEPPSEAMRAEREALVETLVVAGRALDGAANARLWDRGRDVGLGR